MQITYQYQTETAVEAAKIPNDVTSGISHKIGLINAEPLILGLDGILRYAKAYKARFGSPLASDYVLGPAWLSAAKGIRALLNGDGAVAMELGITTDSKDNGACERIFWAAINAAGFTESDL